MKYVTDIKNKVRAELIKHGYKKTSDIFSTENKYFYYSGCLCFTYQNTFYSFGADPVTGVTGCLCLNGCQIECGAVFLFDVFDKHINGEVSEDYIFNCLFH